MTETARVHAQSVYDGLRTAFRRLVKAVGGVEAGAGMTRVSKTTLATYYDRNSVPQAWAPMDVIIDLEDAAGEPLVTRELARALGYELVPAVDEPQSAGMVDLLRIVAEDSDAGGRFAGLVLQVTRDGRLDPHEIDVLVQRAADRARFWDRAHDDLCRALTEAKDRRNPHVRKVVG